MISCNSDIEYEQESVHFESLSKVGTLTTWQEHLAYAQDRDRVKTRTDDDLYFIGYTHKGTVKSKEEIPLIVKQLFSDDSFIAQYVNNGTLEVVSVKTVVQKAKSLNSNNPFPNIMSQLKDSIRVGMELIELEWSYKGNRFSSMAIASNDRGGIIYDLIGSLIIGEVVYSGCDSDIAVPLIKTRAEPGGGSEERRFVKGQTILNNWGAEVVSFGLACSSSFENNILVDRRLYAFHKAAIGWACEADIKTISGEIDVSNYHEFAYGYVYGSSFSNVSLSFGGFSFSISGGQAGETDTVIHRP